jgi:hypothetical protein
MLTAEEPFAVTEEDAEAQLALLGVSLEDVLGELQFRRQQKLEAALKAQADAARLQGTRKFIRGGDVGGEVDFQIHPVFYHYWGQRLGYECWDDPQFVRELKRDNEVVRVRNESDKIMTGYGSKVAPVKPTKVSAPNKGVRGRRGRWAL